MRKKDECCGSGCSGRTEKHGRRRFLVRLWALAAAVPLLGRGHPFGARPARADDDRAIRRARPQAGDRLTFARGDRKGETIAPDDVLPEEMPLTAYPLDPETGLVRDGSRLNQIVLVRLDPDSLEGQAREVSADGVLAFAATCTHQNCPVSAWEAERETLVCPCHYSEFDPRDDATVVNGPATRRLPSLPLEMRDGIMTVAGTFTGRVGAS